MKEILKLIEQHNSYEEGWLNNIKRKRVKRKITKKLNKMAMDHAMNIYSQTLTMYEEFIFNSLK